MAKPLKDLYNSKIFHGRLTEEEAYDLCKAELTNHGKKQAYIWYLHECEGKLSGRIDGYRGDSEVPFARHHDVQQVWDRYFPGFFLLFVPIQIELNRMDFVERKNPHQLAELARVAILDNCNYCCLKNLIERIDELRIPAMEKEELKKLVRGFQLILASKIPNEL